MPHEHKLGPHDTLLLIVDVQEAFRDAISNFSVLAANISRAAIGFEILGLPVVITEQYPAGLGPTAEEIRFSLAEGYEPIEKSTFSAFGSAEARMRLEGSGAKQILLGGIETHVCVNQTAHDLIHAGYKVHVLTDCVSSRFEHDKLAGLEKMRAAGAVPSSVELALFELMTDSKHEKFKEIQALIK
jgi:nicotinamidase-related amidase